MPSSQSVSEQMTPVMEWLASEPADDPVADLANLRQYFGRLPEPEVAGPLYQQCIEQFELRVADLCDRFKPRLLSAALPLSRELHGATSELVAALLDVARGMWRIAEMARERWRPVRRADPEVLVARALAVVHEAFVLSAMGGAAAPAGLWRCAYDIAGAGAGLDVMLAARRETPAWEAAYQLKRLFALSVLQPESLTPRELSWATEYLQGLADEAVLSRTAVAPLASSFWINPSDDAPPVAMVRNPAPASSELVHFSAFGMSRLLAGQVDKLKASETEAVASGLERDGELLEPDLSDLPLGLTLVEAVSVMARMRDRWAQPPNRAQPRRPHQYSVQVCAGLRAIWEVARPGATSSRIAEWMVYNESPGGYAIMSVGGLSASLSAGMAVALRRDAAHPWSICIVRWIRSENPEQVELGLQVLSQTCTPVSIAFRGADARSTTPALLLPPVTALRRNSAILAPAGTYSSRRFVLVHEGEHLYVAQARVLSLDMQTANIELFQYEVDPYPI
ncbi:MAG TPA: hypothetical protein VJ673_16245 [Aromatoleum sp.]|uniref:hypothetical protein n=1 Tax=Aromatoleum sp. TaxID=2307007 RepID=UPI002B49ECDE|nr:hypothetical protein [Aromatoleum sp.]HJV27239.1 hypothetical protein [Aromatoleum sp.]